MCLCKVTSFRWSPYFLQKIHWVRYISSIVLIIKLWMRAVINVHLCRDNIKAATSHSFRNPVVGGSTTGEVSWWFSLVLCFAFLSMFWQWQEGYLVSETFCCLSSQVSSRRSGEKAKIDNKIEEGRHSSHSVMTVWDNVHSLCVHGKHFNHAL